MSRKGWNSRRVDSLAVHAVAECVWCSPQGALHVRFAERELIRPARTWEQVQEALARSLQLEAELAIRDGLLQQYEREREIARVRGYDLSEVKFKFCTP